MRSYRRYLGCIIAALALAVVPRLGPAQSSHAADPWPAGSQARYEHEVTALTSTIATHLGRSLGWRIVIILNPVEKADRVNGKLQAQYAWATIRPKKLDCAISFNPSMQELQGRDWAVVVAHEVDHCFQFDINPNAGDWIIEGQAVWVGEEVAGPAPTVFAWAWDRYLEHPEVPLFKRTYTAIGFYAHLDESCISPWKILDAMLKAAKRGDRSAYDAATSHCAGGTAEPFLDSWASGLFRDASYGHDWNTTGPAIPWPSMVNPVPHEIPLANGQAARPVSAAPFTNGIYTLVSGADIVQVAATGHARLSDGNVDRVLHGQTDFCTRSGGCSCPSGSAYQGPPLIPLARHADLALTGGPAGTKVTLTGQSLDDLCTKRPAPPLPSPSGSLPNPCTIVTLGDLEQIVGRNPDYIYHTSGRVGNQDAPACEQIVVGAGVSGAVLIVVEKRGTTNYSGAGKAIVGFGDEAYLFTRSDYARLVAAKGRFVILIQVTMGARSTRIALALGRTALSRL